jgi:hypothetical protein
LGVNAAHFLKDIALLAVKLLEVVS